MIVGSKSYGDDNVAAMWIQHEEYGKVIGELVWRAALKYRDAEILLDVSTEAGKKFTHWYRMAFDHRVVQEAHDLMAAYFRFKELLPGPLFKEKIDKADFIHRWGQFASAEIGELLESPRFTRAVCLAIAEQINDTGYANEDIMVQFLKGRYSDMLEKRGPA